MEAAHRISRLCEGWQARVQDSTREDQAQFAREFLKLLGWDEPTSVDIAPGKQGLAFVLRGNSPATLLAQFVMPGLLEPPGTVVSRGLDYCACTRTVVPAIRQSSIHYALITDLFRSYLYDVREDELVLHADSPDMFNREMARELARNSVERGGLDDLRREPRSHAARQLRECCQHWSSIISGLPGGSEKLAEMILDRLLLLRFMADQDVIRGINWSLRAKFKQLLDEAVEAEQPDLGARLGRVFEELWRTWGAQMYQPLPQVQAILESPGVAGPLLRDFAFMSRNKFTIASILESFNFGDADEKARVRLVPEADEDREMYLARQTRQTIDLARIEIDLLDEGYRAVVYWFDRMVEACKRVGTAIGREPFPAAAPSNEVDLFAWSEIEAARPEAVQDAYQHVAENGLKILYTTPRQFRTARLILYLHIVERYRGGRQRFVRFPDIERALVKRPAMSERDKKRLYGG